jgi:hypothetical protein
LPGSPKKDNAAACCEEASGSGLVGRTAGRSAMGVARLVLAIGLLLGTVGAGMVGCGAEGT